MKTLPAGLQAHLDSGATTLCHAWKLVRQDGATLGFTDHDEALEFAGVNYEAVSGFTASAVETSLGLAVDNLEVLGALSSAALAESDLAAGLYDDAEVEIWRVNWTDVSQRVLLRRGNLGEVSRGALAFTAEVRGLAHRLNQPTGRLFQYMCDADLGDERCGVDLEASSFKGSGAVTSATGRRVFEASGLDGFASDWFSRGRVLWTSGANAARAMEVKAHALSAGVVSVELWQPMARDIEVGATFDVHAGCDKHIATCRSKFANVVNFRGFPHMPGNDFVIAYPNSGDKNKGGSLVKK